MTVVRVDVFTHPLASWEGTPRKTSTTKLDCYETSCLSGGVGLPELFVGGLIAGFQRSIRESRTEFGDVPTMGVPACGRRQSIPHDSLALEARRRLYETARKGQGLGAREPQRVAGMA